MDSLCYTSGVIFWLRNPGWRQFFQNIPRLAFSCATLSPHLHRQKFTHRSTSLLTAFPLSKPPSDVSWYRVKFKGRYVLTSTSAMRDRFLMIKYDANAGHSMLFATWRIPGQPSFSHNSTVYYIQPYNHVLNNRLRFSCAVCRCRSCLRLLDFYCHYSCGFVSKNARFQVLLKMQSIFIEWNVRSIRSNKVTAYI